MAYTCPICGVRNGTGIYCLLCAAEATTAPPGSNIVYACPQCGLRNHNRSYCLMCSVAAAAIAAPVAISAAAAAAAHAAATAAGAVLVDDEEVPASRKRRRDLSQEPSDRRVRPVATIPSSYALAHTLGRCRYNPHGGDGAYSKWMQGYFSDHLDPRGCVHVQRLRYKGAVGNASNEEAVEELRPVICREFQNFLQHERISHTNTIVLNWHLRFTGNVNGWTGRRPSPALIAELTSTAREARKNLVVVYTVHEFTRLPGVHRPDAYLALNPDVERRLRGAIPTRLSRVPNLMTSCHTASVDLIMRYAGLPMGEATNLASGFLLQRLKLPHCAPPASERSAASLREITGIVLFGMITARHGTTVANVTSLCGALALAGLPPTFRVVIAGSTQDEKLQKALQDYALVQPRLNFHGLLNSFDDLVRCKYAISFDKLGFRSNASAMVNVTRAGHLLFSRRGGETDDALIRRTVRTIEMCERNPSLYGELLCAQQPRFRNGSPELVGQELDQHFRTLAAITCTATRTS